MSNTDSTILSPNNSEVKLENKDLDENKGNVIKYIFITLTIIIIIYLIYYSYNTFINNINNDVETSKTIKNNEESLVMDFNLREYIMSLEQKQNKIIKNLSADTGL